MAIPFTFIESAKGVRLTKRIGAQHTEPFPRVRQLTSHSHYIAPSMDGLRELFDLMQDHASRGHAMLRGILRRPLVDESRKGQVDKFALTQWLALDIDGYRLPFDLQKPYTADTIRLAAEQILRQLPEPLQQVSYIAHASSSQGLKPDASRVGLHLVFLLAAPVGPDGLKEWLLSLNFASDSIREQLTLSPQNTTLHYLIDPVMANNSHIMYIAPPTFEDGVTNPFQSDADRWVLVEKGAATLDLIPLLAETCPQQNRQNIDRTLTELRKARGLKKHTPRTRMMRSYQGDKVQVVTNPDQLRIDYAYENEEFVYFNVNGGDSCAYFVPKHNPDIIYNFKGEPPFEFAKANPRLYEWYCDKYRDVIRERAEILPLVFRDFTSDKHFAALVDVANDRVERIAEISKTNIEDWMADQGRSVPDPIPTWDYRFDPHSPTVYDPDQRSLNQYQMPAHLKEPCEILPQYHARLGEGLEAMRQLCPTIHTLMFHMSGGVPLEYELFLNWLAAAVQGRDKLATAWIFSGKPGTGKGLFYEKILRPLVGEDYVQRKRIDHLEDKYNGYLQKCLFLVYDEFRLSDSKNDSKVLNHIKDDIAAETGTVRDMYARPETTRLYTNYLFFSNHNDVIRIEDGDRRFNVATPQHVKLADAHPEVLEQLDRIEDELPQFASFLMHYTVDQRQARTCLENEAKARMKVAALAWHEQFCLAIRAGNLDYFIDDMLEMDMTNTDPAQVIKLHSAQKIVRGWVRDAIANEQTKIPVPNLLTVYSAMSPNETTPKKFASMLGKNDITIDRLRIDGKPTRAVLTRFTSYTQTPDELEKLLETKGTTFTTPGDGPCPTQKIH